MSKDEFVSELILFIVVEICSDGWHTNNGPCCIPTMDMDDANFKDRVQWQSTVLAGYGIQGIFCRFLGKCLKHYSS